MFDKLLSLAFVVALLQAPAVAVPARAQEQGAEEEARLVKLVKKAGRLAKYPRCKARVKLKDGRELKGRIAEATDEYFVLVSSETRTATTVRYPQVAELKQSRPSMIPFVVGMVGVFCLLTIPFLVSGPT
jgi:hypothetical protein